MQTENGVKSAVGFYTLISYHFADQGQNREVVFSFMQDYLSFLELLKGSTSLLRGLPTDALENPAN